jgi:hypothetical protein
LSDFNNEINDQVASYYPAGFEGTVGLSTHRFSQYRAGAAPSPADANCLKRVLPADPKVQPFTNSAYEVAKGSANSTTVSPVRGRRKFPMPACCPQARSAIWWSP